MRTRTAPVPGTAAHTTLSRHPAAARRARIWARTTLGGWSVTGPTADDAELIVSELVTNAIVHSLGRIRAHLAIGPEGLRIEVHDAGPAPLRPTVDTAASGRGLAITRSLSTGCGWDSAPGRSTAWATLPAAA
ncbi:ATP-binding protein [Actinacidiphila sp. bgisy144]|uniref:ATP-binding protein n=1 Tax=Actinacidiphila sp. bgisy144 TaxID=3413791 RepID=UPI003EC0336D